MAARDQLRSKTVRPEGSRIKLIRANANEVVFENPQHDFPQRIIYSLKDGGRLTAAIEGTKNGKTRRVELNYQQTKS